MIGCSAIFQAMNSAGVFGYVTAYGAGRLARRIRRIIKAMMSHRARKLSVDQPRLHARDAVLGIDAENFSHARQFDHHSAIDGESSARQSSAGASRGEADACIGQ